MSFAKSKPKRWICSHCDRINDPEDESCAFCQQPKQVKEDKKKKGKAYDEIHLWPVFSQFIRLRDSDKNGMGKCITCGISRHWRKADCGHGVPRQHKGTKYNEQNNHLQCKKCNGFQGGMREVYKSEMDKRYGAGTWDKMIVASRQVSKLGKVEIDIMVQHYEKETERLLIEKPQCR